MKEYTIEQINQSQAQYAASKAPKVQVKPQVSKIVPMYFNDRGERIIEQVKEEAVVEKTNVTRIQFKNKEGQTITTKTDTYNENDLM